MITSLILLNVLLIVLYWLYIQWVKTKWNQSKPAAIPNDYPFKTKISVIIPVRNEALHIKKCINSLLNNDYPAELFEIIIVNDHSDDETVSIVESIHDERIKLLHLSDYLSNNNNINAFKKAALSYGIQKSTGNLIITTDGDSFVGQSFLKSYAFLYETEKPNFIGSIVEFEKPTNNIETFQYYDMISMMGITAAGIKGAKYYMANGANLGFNKSTFLAINPFDNNNSASGDDMFLIQEMAQIDKTKIAFLKEEKSIITTSIMHTYKDFGEQRKRWASKSKQYKESNIKCLMSIIFLVNIFPVFSILVNLYYQNSSLLIISILSIFLKMIIDYFYLSKMSEFYKNTLNIKDFMFSFFFYYVYILYTGMVGIFPSRYEWKEREVK